ncbi:MAG: hypothetical protein HC877_23990 [Thioploca sp.]|nr:hypothetical protein [Thioploca sp.]
MLQIYEKQVEYFDHLMRTNFHQRLKIFLRKEMPEETDHYNDETLLRHIQECDQSAKKFKVETESGIAQWSCLTLLLDTKLEDIPEFLSYMQDNSLPADSAEEKIDKLVNYLNLFEVMQL